MAGRLSRTGWVLISIGAALMFLLAARYFVVNLQDAADSPQGVILRDLYLRRPIGLYIHAFSMMAPLVIGPVEFFLRRISPPRRRAQLLPWHRWLGRIYVVSALIGGLSGLYLAFYAHGGFVSEVGFGSLAVLLLVTTSIAYLRIRSRDEFSHKEWMTRSYALIFAAITLRILLPLYNAGFGIEITEAYQTVAWTCWVPNLLVAEIINSRRRTRELKLPAR